jgi:hypothetical protein
LLLLLLPPLRVRHVGLAWAIYGDASLPCFFFVRLRTVAEPGLQPCVVNSKLCSQIHLFIWNFHYFSHDFSLVLTTQLMCGSATALIPFKRANPWIWLMLARAFCHVGTYCEATPAAHLTRKVQIAIYWMNIYSMTPKKLTQLLGRNLFYTTRENISMAFRSSAGSKTLPAQ